MLDLRNYIQDRLDELNQTYNGQIPYTFKVYDEFSYTFSDSNPNLIPLILSSGAIQRTDVVKNIYQYDFVLNFQCEKNGYRQVIDTLNNFWLEYNSTNFSEDGYVGRVEMQSPIVLAALGDIDDGYYTSGCIRGSVYLQPENELFIRSYRIKINNTEYSFYPINPIIKVSPVVDTQPINKIGVSHVSHYTREITFTLWDDNSTVNSFFHNILFSPQTSGITFIQDTNRFENLIAEVSSTTDTNSGRTILSVRLIQ